MPDADYDVEVPTEGVLLIMAAANATADAEDYAGLVATGTQMGGLLNVDPPEETVAMIKTSDSETHVHTYLGGREEPGVLSASLKYTAATAAACRAVKGLKRSWLWVAQDGSGEGRQAILQSYKVNMPTEQDAIGSIAIKLQGSGASVAFTAEDGA